MRTNPAADGDPARAARLRRRLTPEQFAFVRAILQGLSLREAAERYLEPGTDLRVAQTELRAIRTELQAAARRAGAYGDARALELDIAQIPVGKGGAVAQAPSLEAFRAEVDPDGFFGEAELLQQYRERFPVEATDRRASRLARLRERQMRALSLLEQVLVTPPKASDPPSAWLEPRVAARIEAVGLRTLDALVDWIRIKGFAWWRVIPRVGPVAAARVVAWLRANAKALGLAVPQLAHLGREQQREIWRADSRTTQLALVPIERLTVPAELDGSRGTNRVAGVQHIQAVNDYAAIQAWLAARGAGNANTLRTYRREAERLLLWAVFQQRKAMSSLTVDDAIAFRTFLANPQPAQRWVSRRAVERLSPDWRPFTGPLSARSVQFAITVVGSLFDWLVRQHYLMHNIWSALPKRATVSAAAEADPDRLEMEAGRYLTLAQWKVVREAMRAAGDDERALRVRFAIALAYGTGLRISELVDARIGRLSARLADDDSGDRIVTLRVMGKGGRVREVPFVPQLEEALDICLEARGLPDWAQCLERGLTGIRLIGHLSSREAADRPITPNTLYREVKVLFAEAAALLERRGLAEDARRLRDASTHWLRHTFGRHSMGAGVKANVVQAILGHASLATTTRYTSEDGVEQYAAVRDFVGRRL